MTAYHAAFAAMFIPIVVMLVYGLSVRSRTISLIGAVLLVAAGLLVLALYLQSQARLPL